MDEDILYTHVWIGTKGDASNGGGQSRFQRIKEVTTDKCFYIDPASGLVADSIDRLESIVKTFPLTE